MFVARFHRRCCTFRRAACSQESRRGQRTDPRRGANRGRSVRRHRWERGLAHERIDDHQRNEFFGELVCP